MRDKQIDFNLLAESGDSVGTATLGFIPCNTSNYETVLTSSWSWGTDTLFMLEHKELLDSSSLGFLNTVSYLYFSICIFVDQPCTHNCTKQSRNLWKKKYSHLLTYIIPCAPPNVRLFSYKTFFFFFCILTYKLLFGLRPLYKTGDMLGETLHFTDLKYITAAVQEGILKSWYTRQCVAFLQA